MNGPGYYHTFTSVDYFVIKQHNYFVFKEHKLFNILVIDTSFFFVYGKVYTNYYTNFTLLYELYEFHITIRISHAKLIYKLFRIIQYILMIKIVNLMKLFMHIIGI
eukprot:335489_1